MADSDFDLAACLDRVRRRDEAAARRLVEHLQPMVARVVRAHLPQRDEPEDLMQEVFLKVFSRLEQYRGQVPFEHWVARVAVSTCLDRLRAQRRRPLRLWSELSEPEQALLESLAADAPPGGAGAETAAWEIVSRLLDALAPAERLLMTLLEFEQKTPAEVSALTGWSSGVVRIRAFRARRKLRALYAKLERGKL
ncbi:MAG TPA: RNA polymerase sigma factor [Methylomirabilota bacterium]|nr:RNA polymerase sigma factor [Methylomirabilota bacterium]